MNKKRIQEFDSYLNNEVSSAINELNKINESSRRHLQKLVYTNLVDRFDHFIDHLVLDNYLNQKLFDEALLKLTDPLTEGDLLKILVNSDKLDGHIEERLKGVLRNGVLRNRHSKKVSKAFEVFSVNDEYKKLKVNPSSGCILETYKQQNNKVPSTLFGFADWLYSRRNVVVHGGGSSKMLKNDLDQLKTHYACVATPTVKIKVGSISTAFEFYKGISKLLKEI
jgi:hypothetical protein